MRLGLGMVHQHFTLVPTQSVAENVVLGREPRRGPFFDRATARRVVAETAARFGLRLDPDALVGDVSVGEQQRVEIVKVLVRGARTLILDEPTAVLTPQEVDDLARILRQLVGAGHAVVLISHRLAEVLALADRITVLRAGRVVGEMPAAGARESDLAQLVVGRELRPPPPRRAARPAEVRLQLFDVATAGGRGALHGVSLEVRAGEVLGIAGVDGNGQRALAHVVVGLAAARRGRVVFEGRDIAAWGVAARRAAGIAYVPEDRQVEGLVPSARLDENLILGQQRQAAFGRGPWLDAARVRAHAVALLERFEVRPARPELPATALSGGNQQRLVLARELGRDPRLLLLGQPTRGVDVGGIEFIHARILAARDAGCAVLLVSADLNEILTLADRIAVLFEGRVVGTLPVQGADPLRLGALMTGMTVGEG
jgi:simple sugar transport system ATP-binding protein